MLLPQVRCVVCDIALLRSGEFQAAAYDAVLRNLAAVLGWGRPR